jgi:two-component system invasion response regulator UvrY
LTRVLLADDHPLLHHALGDLLGEEYEVLPPISTLAALDSMLLESDERVDLLLLDLIFRDESSLPRVPRYLRRRPELKVVVVSGYFGMATGEALFPAGAHGGFSKLDDPQELLQVMRTVMGGMQGASSAFLRRARVGHGHTRQLGEQTLRVIELLASGLSYKQVAELMCVGEKTIEYHACRARQLLGIVGSRHRDWQAVWIGLCGIHEIVQGPS